MEYLDAYDENGNFLGKYSREEVHEKGMWHNTIHCWIYDNDNNVYFQVRSDDGKLYTTASGHVRSGETIKEAFGRETKEEIGIDVNYEEAELIRINHWKMDKEKNGKMTHDRAFSNIHILNIKEEPKIFNFTDGEVIGVVKLNASETLKLFNKEASSIKGTFINKNHEHITKDFTLNDFLLWSGEEAITKYGYIVDEINKKFIEL
ncbi:MAG: NUDIX domain-containing protein [Ruminococcus sp.]|nr:NUDIX domain-containing protein [Ruminococcus sp.]